MRKEAGQLRDPVSVMSFSETEGGGFEWARLRKVWAETVPDAKPNLFSSVGVGARGVTFTIREAPWLTLHHAFRLHSSHYFLTSIVPLQDSPGYWTVKAALVELTPCEDKHTGLGAFPAVLTEKYVRFDEPVPHASNTLTLVLVTPKAILLKPGKLVEVQGVPCPIRTAHLLDPYKNEYEIERKVDL